MRLFMVKCSYVLLFLISFDIYALAEDKTKHLVASGVIGFSSNLVLKNNLYSFGLCASVGLAKEAYDEIDYGGFSGSDLLFDSIGCALGVAGGNMVNWRLGYKEYNDHENIKMVTIEFDLPF